MKNLWRKWRNLDRIHDLEVRLADSEHKIHWLEEKLRMCNLEVVDLEKRLETSRIEFGKSNRHVRKLLAWIMASRRVDIPIESGSIRELLTK